MLKAILFDLDGTLLDRDASLIKLLEDQYERYATIFHEIPKNEYIKRFVELDAKGYVSKDQVYSQLIDEFELNGTDPEELHQDYLDQFKYHCIGFEQLHITLKALTDRGLKLGIISNGRCQFQMDNIKGLEIESFFDTILISACENLRKPDPEIFNKALSQLEVTAEEAIFVGDHPLNDIKAAHNVGMKTVWKKDMHWGPAEASAVIEDLAELLELADRL
ncbi:L-2-haloalkanoic acid dehalogenase [Jeotgalibacillus alimentarius]|uniref:L-2-haloalkanoic acid dehalogenase n=1 Tax=Jeotgalibacillus alimentarius TaxID=135826 RepID=A0A0C2SBY2_9BACL|nr:HAD-IIIA family hydrolase [Jeotgalibacillus alimentarius]KIL51459.1 L-2-haloalkanoic acid dehalogenase [Jeotgalibacillus alimentarius]